MGSLPYIVQFYDSIDIFLLILVRVLGFFLLVPVISGMNIPMQIKVALAVTMSAVIFASGTVNSVLYNDSVIGYFILILTEFLAGALMGYILYFIFNIIFYTGQLIDYKIGFAMVNVLDPLTQIQVPVVGNLFFMALCVLLIASDGLHMFLGAFIYAYEVLPLGAANIMTNAPLAWFVVTILTQFIVLAVKIAFPVMAVMVVVDVALGVMVKAVPQMNIFVVGMPIKVLLGLLLLLFVIGPMLGVIFNNIFEFAYNSLIEVIWGLSY